MIKKAWGGRFDRKEHPLLERFNASLAFDQRLYAHDITGSLAHARMLRKIGLLTAKELLQITTGLKKIEKEIQEKRFKFLPEHEDIHMAIEARLIEMVGPVGGKLHTARSRNDQVALDTKLYVRAHTHELVKKIHALQTVVVQLAQKHSDVILPGYTHLQRAQPILLTHHALAYFEMLCRDRSRFEDNLKRLAECPLGAGALAGSTIPVDRAFVAKELHFEDVTHNSLDTVSDRDFIFDFLSAASILMMHLSRLAEELILWSSQEFGFIELPQEFCTGSSMMPQKINPDAVELIRGKTGRVYGNLMALLTTMKALPLTYNKDMQEDKEPLFDTEDTLTLCLDVLTALLPKIKFHTENMRQATEKGFLLATDIADYLAQKGLPFREAHAVVGKIIRYALSQGLLLEEIDLKTYQGFSKKFQKDITAVLSLTRSISMRKTTGGTAQSCVKGELRRAQRILEQTAL